MTKIRKKPDRPMAPFYDSQGFFTYNPYLKRMLDEFPERVINPSDAVALKGKWQERSKGKPLHLEIGCGKGRFISKYAKTNTDKFTIGIELKIKRLYLIAKKLSRVENPDAYVIQFDGSYLDMVFEENELDKVFLFFPDPWFKKERQGHNRLVTDNFLEMIFKILKPGGRFEMKTDHKEYFPLVVELFENTKFNILRKTEDLHQSPWNEGNIMTEFETLFAGKGKTCQYILVEKPSV